jgi:hypothetical protein
MKLDQTEGEPQIILISKRDLLRLGEKCYVQSAYRETPKLVRLGEARSSQRGGVGSIFQFSRLSFVSVVEHAP